MSTISGYKPHVRSFICFLCDSDNFVKISKEIVKEYTEKQIEEFLKKLETEEASASLISKTMSALRLYGIFLNTRGYEVPTTIFMKQPTGFTSSSPVQTILISSKLLNLLLQKKNPSRN